MDTTIQNDERVIITGLDTGQDDYNYSMTELAELAQANHMEVVQRVDQVIDRPNPATYFGKGKVAEIAELAAANDVTTVITNDELSPSQLRNLEDETGKRILDRTALILEIFATRAQTKEAKLQVQIAELQYRLPRLQTSASQRLDQQTGGGSGFTNRGAGETKLEMDRRTIQHQITHLRHELAAIDKSEETKRKQRAKSNIPTAALVGYTNAGKSTIMNGLVRRYGTVEDKTVFEKDMLFATLDTSVRRLTLPGKKDFLLSDTVGFVSKLPTNLVESFKSTLAEAANADLLIQVIDYSDPNYEEMMQTTKETLKQIGIDNIPMVNVFNKADKTEIEFPVLEGDDQVVISAKQEESLDLLVDVIRKHLFKDYVEAKLLLPFSAGQQVSYLNEHTNILDTEYRNDGTLLTVEMSPQDAQRFAQYQV
ncbi:MAG: GTPase HflX [Limosilactobacillus oris]|jgi:GTP-binding protein HflX|uniref:GTPase HflX n=1 Tax=Limosilactobacillus oris TaxID=1632 RepID=UPI00174D3A50|nr:GTPase HflX [Limosilactobacillus oris]MCH3910910.1 GTPase HflX [Limosilactobacillus oris]MCH3938162.1 GTPase HflX [Limosilactobacillus oris]MCI1980599.1 GTPase HflX [Limosilactobacillus oris]UXC66606.1 GTPase HflX [Limosilactobacillus oris]